MRLFDRLSDITVCLVFLTRIPLGGIGFDAGRELSKSTWAFGIVGAFVGGIGAVVYAIALIFGLTPLVAATLAVAAVAVATGCLHEDGLTDTVDGLGGGRDREAKLRIMRDSHLGAYAAIALFLILMLRISIIAALGNPVIVGSILIAAAATSRTAMAVVMAWLPPARSDGLGAGAGAPDAGTVAIGVLITIVVTYAVVPAAVATGILLAVVCAGIAVAWIARRHIGGHTGDVLGATQQVGEAAALITAVALS